MKKLLIWGAGDQGAVTLDCALAMNKYSKIDLLDFKEKGHRQIPDFLIYEESREDIEKLMRLYDEVIVAAGDNELRKIKTMKLISMGISLATIIHPTAIINSSAKISQGTTILAGAAININVEIGIGCIINTQAVIEHDCIVEDFTNICPKVSIAGHVNVGERVFMGIGSTVINNIKIGKGSIIGAGAAVIKNIPENVVAVGVPAKIIKKKL